MSGSAEVGAVHVSVGLDSAKFEDGLRKVQDRLGALDLGKGLLVSIKQMEGGLDELAGKLGGFGSALTSIGGVGLLAAGALGGVAEALKRTQEAVSQAAEWEKLSKSVGVSTDFIQKFNFAASQSDIDIGSADQALKNLNESLGAVQKNLPRAKQLAVTFGEALNLTPAQLRGYHDVSELMPVIADRIKNAGTVAEQAAIAKKLGIEELLPLLRGGAAGFKALADQAQQLGLVMDASLIQKGAEAEKQIKLLDAVTKAQADITFIQFANTLLKVKSAFNEVKLAGLDFLAIFTGTLSPEREVAKIKGQLDDLQRPGTALSPAQQSLFNGLNARLTKLQQQQAKDVKPEEAGPAATPPIVGAGDAKKAGQVRLASLEAINAAQKAELEAEQALVGDVRQLAVLRLAAVDTETKAANDKLAQEAANGKITEAAAAQAQTANNAKATAQRTQILRERDAALAQEAVQQESELAGYAQRIAGAQSQFAATAADRAKIEEAALAVQQQVERDQLRVADRAKIVGGKITVLKALELEDGQKLAQLAETERKAREDQVAIVREKLERDRAGLENQAAILGSEADLLKSSTARADVEAKILAIKQQLEELDLAALIRERTIDGAGAEELDLLQQRLATLRTVHANELKVAQAETSLVNRMQEAADAVSGLKDAFGRHDWASSLDQLQRTIETVTSAFAKGAGTGLATLGSVAGQAIGGKAGSALSTGIGVGVAAGTGAAALGSLGAVLGGTFIEGGIGAGLLGAAAFLGPLAPILGIVAGLAVLFTNTKPSNFTASAAFNGTSGATFGGDKPNDATTGLVTQSANAILQAEQTLTAAGATLSTTVKGLEIGQRDPSKITLSNGQVLNSSVGDASKAVDTALKAVLAGAQFTDQAEQKLVSSLLDAGKGFDDIVTALNNYQAAQAALAPVTDAILQLTDPNAFDIKKVKDGIDQQRAAFKAAADAGYITADQLTQVNAQLDKLQGLQVDQILAKTAQAAQQAADQGVQAAQDTLSKARDAEATVLQGQIDKYKQVSDGLDAFLQSLDQASSSPATANLAQLARLFASTSASAALGNADAGAQLAGVAQQFQAAGLAQAHTAQEARAIEDKIRAGVTAAADTAKRQVSLAQQQLDSLNATVDQLLNVNENLVSVEAAIAGLAAAQAAASGAYANAIASAQAGPNVTAGVAATTPDVTGPALVTDINPGTMDIATSMDFQARALAVIAKNTGNSSDLADLWTNGLPLPVKVAV